MDASSLSRLVAFRGRPQDLNDADRQQALKLAEEVIRELEPPASRVMRYAYQGATYPMCLRIGVDLNIFHNLVANDDPVTSQQLAELAGAEEVLVIRILRVLGAINVIDEVGPQTYRANATTRCLTQPAYEATVRLAFDSVDQIYGRLPFLLKDRGYRCPTEMNDCPLQWTFGTDMTYFDWIASDPQRASDLRAGMKSMAQSTIHWTDYYPVTERLVNQWEKGTQFLVDVGGGSGTDLKILRERFPHLEGSLTLQDLPAVASALDDSETLKGITVMGHDFFGPQPIRGARSYFTHRVIHNWSDPKVRSLLTQLKDAMRPGYSRLLLNETLLPEVQCPAFDAAGDINMMCILASIKRTESQLTRVIESIETLRVEKVWRSADRDHKDCLIEVMRTSNE